MAKVTRNFQRVANGRDNDFLIFDLGDDEYGIYDLDRYDLDEENERDTIEIWFNHNFNGSGINNLRVTAFGKELDLEFCHSRKINAEEQKIITSL